MCCFWLPAVPPLTRRKHLKPAVRAGLKKKLQYVDESPDDQWICGPAFYHCRRYLFTVLRWAYGVKTEYGRG